MGRAILKDSLLPAKFYNEAQNHAAYLFNRMPHGESNITPYEYIHKRKPNLSRLQPFGSVCYAFIPPEKRDKLSESGIKCRLLGYGDDFEAEEINGYKLLREIDGEIMFSDNVVFPPEVKMERLADVFYALNDDTIRDQLWTPFTHKTTNDEKDDQNDQDTNSEYYSALEEETTDDEDSDKEEQDEEELSETELSNITTELLERDWWKPDGICYALRAITTGTPLTYKEAMSGPDRDLWTKACEIEMENIRRNKTYELRQTKNGEKAIGCRWVLKIKLKPNGEVDKYKARLVAKGYAQRKGRDYIETFAPVAKFKSLRIILALAAMHKWKVYHDDVTSAFLNGKLKETVLMDQPEGFVEKDTRYKWDLKKALYGLKQAPREWNTTIDDYLTQKGFKRCMSDACIYVKNGNDKIILGLYVDDVIVTGSNGEEVQRIRNDIKQRFKCSEGGLLTGCLGMEVTQSESGIILSQETYIRQKLEKYDYLLQPHKKTNIPLDPNFQELLIEAEKSTDVEENFPYREIIGSLMYASTATRPDLTTALGILSRFNAQPKKIHCNMVRQILYYLRKYPSLTLNYSGYFDTQLSGYVDASWGNNEDYSSISGYSFFLGKSLISWSSKKQSVPALSSTEAEYVAVTSSVQEALWAKSLLEELGYQQETIPIYEDNEACINLSKNPQEYKRTRHIQVKYHFIRNHVKDDTVQLKYIPTAEQKADMFTKGLNGPQLNQALKFMHLLPSNQPRGELEMANYSHNINKSTKDLIGR
jgi:hypothetical protein